MVQRRFFRWPGLGRLKLEWLRLGFSLALLAWGAPLAAQTANSSDLTMSATLTANGKPLKSGLHWRVYPDQAKPDGTRDLINESTDATPTFHLDNGSYIVHAGFGLAGVSKRIAIEGRPISDRIVLNAGALALSPVLGGNSLPANKVTVSIFVPERNNSEAKLVVASAKPGEIIPLPEGRYHVKSIYLDTVGVGALDSSPGTAAPTNSVVAADIAVQTGKITDVTLRHRAATLTLKLVNKPGGEALANTSFTVLTPGGDVIRELIGAFPSLILAEGDYVAIARHDTKTYQGEFQVQSAYDRDIEILAK
jgi:hypothetical protein